KGGRMESGGRAAREPRLFDAVKGETRSMRSKEEAHDYRYFPEPDLPPLRIPPGLVERIEKELPELPRAKLERFAKEYGLSVYDAKILVSDRSLAAYVEQVGRAYGGPAKKLANWFTGELLRLLNESGTALSGLRFGPPHFAALLKMVDAGELSNNAAKDVFAELFHGGRDPKAIA